MSGERCAVGLPTQNRDYICPYMAHLFECSMRFCPARAIVPAAAMVRPTAVPATPALRNPVRSSDATPAGILSQVRYSPVPASVLAPRILDRAFQRRSGLQVALLFLCNCHRIRKLARCRELLGMAPTAPTPDPPADYRDRFKALTGRSLRECPHCHAGIMVVINSIARTRICQLVPDTS
jgi:hypothetical protein